MFIYLFTIVYYDYIKTVQSNVYIDWDVKTITAGDYSIEFDMEQDTYDYWLEHYHDKSNPMSECAQFKLYCQNELEERITAMENLGFDGEDPGKIKIAQVTFAYNNAKVIEWLKKRGTLIKTEKWEKVADLNEQILKELKDTDKIVDKKEKKNLIDLLQTPCSVFATFESEEGYNRAKKYSDQPQKCFCMQQLDIQEASEPTDIIWENRFYSENTRNFRRVIVWTIIGIMLAMSGAIIFFMTNYSLKLKFKYPKVDCEIFHNEYNNSGTMDLSTW